VVANNINARARTCDSRQGRDQDRLLRGADGENEALFVADRKATLLARAVEHAKPRGGCALPPNSQARCFERPCAATIAISRVGGFSFYERAEIKD